MSKVIFDSSFLMAVAERPTTWFEDIVNSVGKFEPVLLDCVRVELEKISRGDGKRSRSARVALDMASKFSRAPCGSTRVDDEVISAALSSKAIVATTDAGLRKALRDSHVRVVLLRGGRVDVG